MSNVSFSIKVIIFYFIFFILGFVLTYNAAYNRPNMNNQTVLDRNFMSYKVII